MNFAIDPRFANVSSSDWMEFCRWLRECCGYSSIRDIPTNRQYDAYLLWLDECRPEDDIL